MRTFMIDGKEFRVATKDKVARWMRDVLRGRPCEVVSPLRAVARTLERGDVYVWEYQIVGQRVVEVFLPLTQKQIEKHHDFSEYLESWVR